MLSKEDSKPMTAEAMHMFLMLAMDHMSDKDTEDLFEEITEYSSFFYGVILKRIEVLKLPIKLERKAWIYLLSFLDRVGAAVLSVIDMLEYLDKREGDDTGITIHDLVSIYPYGFYNDDAAIKRIDKIKNKEYTSDWCKIY